MSVPNMSCDPVIKLLDQPGLNRLIESQTRSVVHDLNSVDLSEADEIAKLSKSFENLSRMLDIYHKLHREYGYCKTSTDNNISSVYEVIKKFLQVVAMQSNAGEDFIRPCWTHVSHIIRQQDMSNISHITDLVNVTLGLMEKYVSECKISHQETEGKNTNITMCISALSEILKKSCDSNQLSIDVQKHIFEISIECLRHADCRVAGWITSSILPEFFKELHERDRPESNDYVIQLWNLILSCHRDYKKEFSPVESMDVMTERSIFLLCGVADIIFPPSALPVFTLSLLQGHALWEIIQYGFYHSSTLTRKRAMYLFKRILDITETLEVELPRRYNEAPAVFWWMKSKRRSLSDLWQTFILLIETLEEKQTHVIRPLMPRIQLVIEAANTGLLHTSWLLCLAKRAACHDSKQIQTWIVTSLLQMDYEQCPVFRQDQMQFFSGPFIQMTSVASLYHKPNEATLGQIPPVAETMCDFFKNVSQLKDETTVVGFFTSFLGGLKNQYWSGPALVFITRALSHVQPRSVLDTSVLPDIRELMTTALVNLAVHLRSSVQFYLVDTFLKLVDIMKLDLESFGSVLAMLTFGETFCRSSILYQKIVNFTQRSAKLGSSHLDQRAVKDYLVAAVQNFLKENKHIDSEGGTESVDYLRSLCSPIVRLLLVVLDSGLVKQMPGEQTPMQVILLPIMEILTTMNTRAYMSTQKACRSIALLTVLMEESVTPKHNADDSVMKDVGKFVESSVDEIILFIQRNISNVTCLSSMCTISLFCDVLQVLAKSYWREFSNSPHLPTLLQVCIQLANSQKQSDTASSKLLLCASLSLLATVVEVTCYHRDAWGSDWVRGLLEFSRQWHMVDHFVKPQGTELDVGQNSQTTWGKLASDFLSAQWRCQYLVLLHTERPCTNPSVTLSSCTDALDVVGCDNIRPVLSCMECLLRFESSDEKRVQALETAWSHTQETLKVGTFWEGYEKFLDILLAPGNLSQDSGTPIAQLISKIMDDIFSLGQERQGLVNQVMLRLCSWARSDDESLRLATGYVETFMGGLLFGPAHNRGRRFDNEVLQFLKTQPELPFNELQSFKREDILVRVEVLSVLASLQPNNHIHKAFAQNMISSLMVRYKKLSEETTYRNFANSMQHRLKHRAFCGLLILLPFIDVTVLPDVFSFLHDLLLRENQPSLRCLAEWMTILLVNRWQHLQGKIWEWLSQGSEKKAAFLASLLTTVGHLGKLQKTSQDQVTFLNTALPAVLPWCMAHHFNVRVFGQATLLSLWGICRENKLETVMAQHSIVESLLRFTETNKHACKNTYKLMDNFFFKFRPVQDYSIETIVSTLPRLTAITDEEWIALDYFKSLEMTRDGNKPHLPLHNPTDQLKHCTPGTWRIRQDGPDDEEESTSGNVQKKVIPWRQMLPETELDMDLESSGKKQQKSGGLVLVASLIDKVPNLGGLCRTSEIFGVSELVISNLRLVEDQAFESLSVSSHKWIPIKQVRPERLKTYLLEMKDAGYTLVGAEQAANSLSLGDFTFPEKTLLLLGNEKEGIPVDILQLLDVCVEIPQQGIVRSLNVHVSGALLIWEYTRQQAQRDTEHGHPVP